MFDETAGVIHFDKSDFVTTPNPKKDAMNQMMEEAKNTALSRLRTTDSLADFLRLYYVALICHLGKASWLFDYPESAPQKPEDILAEYEDARFKKLYAKEAAVVEDMKKLIDTVEDTGQVRVAMARVRESDHAPYEYRVLAAFPNGKKIGDDVLGPPEKAKDEIDFLYYAPQEACVQHACHVLFTQNRISDPSRARAVFEMPYMSWKDVYQSISKHVEGGKSEFILDRTPDQARITQNPQSYIMAGLQNVFSNEWVRTRVSDFWLMNKFKQTKT